MGDWGGDNEIKEQFTSTRGHTYQHFYAGSPGKKGRSTKKENSRSEKINQKV